MITPGMNLIFVHVQKTGGSSISRALGHEVNSKHKHRFASELRQLYGLQTWQGSYKFAFVRNPWDRLVSWWSMINQFRGAQVPPGATFNNFFSYVWSNANTFEEFILNCKGDVEDSNGKKCIFRNQLDYISDDSGNLMVDFIGKFENLQSDFNTVIANAGWVARSLEHKNRTNHQPYYDYYTAHTRDVVAAAYARDIAHFGYEFGA